MAEDCAWAGCPNKAKPRSGLCSMHHWRRQHGKPMDGPPRLGSRTTRHATTSQALREAAVAYADAEDTKRAWHRLRVAAMRWAKSKGWSPSPHQRTSTTERVGTTRK